MRHRPAPGQSPVSDWKEFVLREVQPVATGVQWVRPLVSLQEDTEVTRTSVFSLITLLLALTVGGYAAENPAVLHFGPGANTGLLCPGTSTDAALGCGQDPNPTPPNHLDVFLNSGGASDIELFYLIIGVPVPSGGGVPSVPDITRVVTYNPYPPPQDPSPATNTTGWPAVFCGLLTGASSNAYDECGFDVSNGSNSFVNWYGAAAGLGLDPAQFALFYYDLDDLEDLGGHGLHDVFFDGPLAMGTMEIAYGCATGDCDSACYITPFTEAGQVVPEPATWLMVAGAGLVFLGRIRRKSKSRA
jgi:hypothetical protein